MRTRLLLFLAFALTLNATSTAWAWGFPGHRLTARIAKQHLTDEARAAVKELLDEGEDMATASLWADKVKRSIKGSAPWHYVDVPLDEPRYDAKYRPEGWRCGQTCRGATHPAARSSLRS
jgi:hypothetical protein